MIKKDTFMLCFAGIAFLALPIVAYPKLIASHWTKGGIQFAKDIPFNQKEFERLIVQFFQKNLKP